MNVPAIQIAINLDAGRATLLKDVQESIRLAIIGLSVTPDRVPADLERLPGQLFSLNLAGNIVWTPQEASQRHAVWVVGNTFRDLIEHVGYFLELFNRVLWTWAHAEALPPGDVLAAIEAEEKRFLNLNFPDKLAAAATFGAGVDADLLADMASINRARNCLVHRRGVVTTRDINEDGVLRVRWRQGIWVIQPEEGEEFEVTAENPNTGPGGILALRIVARTAEFPLGSTVQFDAAHLAGVAWGFYFLAEEVVGRVRDHGIACGRLPQPLPADQGVDVRA